MVNVGKYTIHGSYGNCYLIFRKNSTKPVHDICSSRAKPSALGKKSGELIRGDIGVNYDKYS